MAMAAVYDLHGTKSAQDAQLQVYAIYLVCRPMVRGIDVRVTRDVHVDEVIVQRLPRIGIGAIWHVPIIPVVDVLHRLALIWRIRSGKVNLDKFGQIGPVDRRACILH